MQKKRILLWVLVLCVSFCIIFLSVFTHFAFKLKVVDVEFQSRLSQEQTRLEPNIQEKIKSYFEIGENIILMSFDDKIANIEKDIPFVKVNQIIKNFPNILRVYISERIPKFAVKASDKNTYFVLDEDFKILKEISEDDEELNTLIRLDSNNIAVSEEVGMFVQNQIPVKRVLTKALEGIYGVAESYTVAYSIFVEEIDDGSDLKMTITMRNDANEDGKGCEIIVTGEDELETKVFVGISTYYHEISSEDFINNPSTKITVYYVDNEYKAVKSVTI